MLSLLYHAQLQGKPSKVRKRPSLRPAAQFKSELNVFEVGCCATVVPPPTPEPPKARGSDSDDSGDEAPAPSPVPAQTMAAAAASKGPAAALAPAAAVLPEDERVVFDETRGLQVRVLRRVADYCRTWQSD